MTSESDTPRARLSRRILSRQAKISFADLVKAGYDTTVIEAETEILKLVGEWEKLKNADPARAEKMAEPIAELKAWNGVSTLDSKAMTLFALWSDKRIRDPVDPNKNPFPLTTMLESVKTELEKQFGSWRVAWGEINRIQRVPPAMSRSPSATPGRACLWLARPVLSASFSIFTLGQRRDRNGATASRDIRS